MPTVDNSRVRLDPERYRRMSPRHPVGGPEPREEDPREEDPYQREHPIAPELPVWLRQSPVMISSLPSISTSVDGLIRQFYGGPNVPTRRLMLA